MTNAKRILGSAVGLASLIFAASTFAGGPDLPAAPTYSGFVIGVEGGYVNTNWDNIDQNAFRTSDILVRKDYGAGVRPWVGYAFNQYFGLEFGWTYLSEAKFDRWNAFAFNNVPLTNIDNWAWDLSMRLTVPIFGDAGLFTRVGISYLVSDNSIKWRQNLLQAITTAPILHKPAVCDVTLGLGAYYDLTSHLRAEVSWTRFGGNTQTTDNYQPSPDFYALGLSYRF
jgi:opacity protein-like surface antigen